MTHIRNVVLAYIPAVRYPRDLSTEGTVPTHAKLKTRMLKPNAETSWPGAIPSRNPSRRLVYLGSRNGKGDLGVEKREWDGSTRCWWVGLERRDVENVCRYL